MLSTLLESRAIRAATTLIAAGGVVAAVACAEQTPTGPAATPVNAAAAAATTSTATATTTSGSTLVGVTALMRTTPLAAPITRSVTLTAQGGTLQIPEAGLTVTIPRQAVADSTATFTVTALAGSAVAYEFGPHGAKFAQKLKLNQSLSGTTWAGNTGTLKVHAGYFAAASQVNTATGAAQVDEQIDGQVSGNAFLFDVGHFSGYLVSMGRY